MELKAKPLDARLSEKQSRFLDYWFELGDGTKAAIKAGYSEKTAGQMAAQNLKILKNFIDKRAEQVENERIADADEVLKYLTSVMRGEVTEEVIVTESCDGVSTASKMRKEVSPRDRNKAAELLGKRYRLYVDKIEADIDTEITVKLEGDAADWAK